jgi:phage shock protein E
MIYKINIFFFSILSINCFALTVIDVRTLQEWKTGHLEAAIHVEWEDILDISSTISKDEEIYLYCRSGNRSGKAAKILLENGFLNVTNAGSIKEASKLLDINISN